MADKVASRENVVGVRLSDKERGALQILANREERSMSEFLRELLRREIERRGVRDLLSTDEEPEVTQA